MSFLMSLTPLWQKGCKKSAMLQNPLKNNVNLQKSWHLFGVVFGRILCKSMLKMWLGTGAATGVCFIGSWTAPTSKKWHTKPRKAGQSWECCSKSHFGWKREKRGNWCPKAWKHHFWESFLRPGGHTNHLKNDLMKAFFLSGFLVSKKGGGGRARNERKWRVVP